MPKSDEERIEAAAHRYRDAAHGMQSGVQTTLSINEASGSLGAASPKHLRTGVNSAMSDHGALAKLLIDKGIFTEAEYMEAIADAMERERDKYEKNLSVYYGKEVKLG